MDRLTEEEERKYVGQARQGDQQAFAVLVSQYEKKALRTAFSFLHHWEDAREAAQDAFVKAFAALAQFKESSRFSTWFYRILVNRCRDYVRQRKVVCSDMAESAEPEASERSDQSLVNQEISEKVQRALERLPFQQRSAFILRYFDELSLKEIAEIMSLSEGAVKAHLWQAGQKMREGLSAYMKA